MDNETKLSKEQINSIKQELSQKDSNIDINSFMSKYLNEKQQKAVSSLLSDPEKLHSLINSPLAKALLEKLSKEEKE